MREKSEINDLFRTRLQDMKMEVRSEFWEMLEQDLKNKPSPMTAFRTRCLRWVAAASVLLLLGGISFWALLSPVPEDTGKVLAHKAPQLADPVAELPPISVPSDKVKQPVNTPSLQQQEDDEPVSVHVSISITQTQQYGKRRRTNANHNYLTDERTSSSRTVTANSGRAKQKSMKEAVSSLQSSRWSLKALIGTSLPSSDYAAPVTAGVLVERSLGKRFSLEAGLQYSRLETAEDEPLHSLSVPLRVNMSLASNRHLDFYAQTGVSMEKIISGDSSPLQVAVQAGVGLRYKMTDRLAFFAEPSVSHHFNEDSSPRTLRTERPLNLNLLCGLRMTY